MSVPNNNILNSNQFTASVWVNLNSYPTQQFRRIIGKSNFDVNNNGWDIMITNDNQVTKLNARLGGSDYIQIMYPAGPENLVGSWHLVTLTYDGQKAKLYVDNGVGAKRGFDGSQQGQVCSDCNSKYAVYNIVKQIPQNTLPLKIGKDDAYWKKTLNAKIDEVRYYNRALTGEEVKSLFLGTVVNNCGNKIKDAGEECDDGNVVSGDGCTDLCKIEYPIYNSYTRCAGFYNTDGDDINENWDDGCNGHGLYKIYCLNNQKKTLILDLKKSAEFENSETCSLKGGYFYTHSSDAESSVVRGGMSIYKTSSCDFQSVLIYENSYVQDISSGITLNELLFCNSNPDGGVDPFFGIQTNGIVFAIYYSDPICRNGIIEGTETCDDNNIANSDGCSSTCSVESGWSCSGQPSICTRNPVCGNGVIEGTEQCDDGNRISDDDCDNTCKLNVVPIKCGDILTDGTRKKYILSSDLSCPDFGAKVNGNNIKVDCMNHKITKTGVNTFGWGFLIGSGTTTKLSGIEIKNCIISGFGSGINGGLFSGNIQNNEITNSGNNANGGITLAGSYSTFVQGNKLIQNLKGITLTNLGTDNRIENNIICSNTNDFYSFAGGYSGSTGINNQCDNPGSWNDEGITGCTFKCSS